MYADELTVSTVLKEIRRLRQMLTYASVAASKAALRNELTCQGTKLDWIEAELARICAGRGWDLPHGTLLLPNLNIRRLRKGTLTDSDIAQLLIRCYMDTTIHALVLLHRLPCSDVPIEAAVRTICDRLSGSISRLQEYL